LKIWYDTEFLEDGKTIDLISIGMVREDGAELYLVNADADWDRILDNEWLVQNVVPQLGPASEDVRKDVLAEKVRQFVTEGLGKGETAELWGWYSSYDHVVLCQLYGKMIDLPKGFPMFTHDLRQVTKSRDLPKQTEGKHNALEDARWLAKAWKHYYRTPRSWTYIGEGWVPTESLIT
jgi:hypothetical protein